MRSIFSGGGVGGAAPLPVAVGGCGGCARLRVAAVRQSVDQFPQFVQSFARDRRHRQHGIFKHGFKFSQRADPFAARELVDLGRDDVRARSTAALQPAARPPDRSRGPDAAHRRAAAPRRRRGRLDGRIAPRIRLPAVPPEVRPRQLFELARRRRAAARVAVARADRPDRAARRRPARDPVDVRQPRLARRGAGARHALPDQRVDQARLADVRAPDQRDLRQAVARQIAACALDERLDVTKARARI